MKDDINNETLQTVCSDDDPQVVRNIVYDNKAVELVELKRAINNFLWAYLPQNTTLRQAELLADKIFRLIYRMQA